MSKRTISLCFDNGGGLTVQFGRWYVHNYDDMQRAARDYAEYVRSGNTAGWDGNEQGTFPPYDYNDERNGGARWYNYSEVEALIATPSYDLPGWLNIREFCGAAAHVRSRQKEAAQ